MRSLFTVFWRHNCVSHIPGCSASRANAPGQDDERCRSGEVASICGQGTLKCPLAQQRSNRWPDAGRAIILVHVDGRTHTRWTSLDWALALSAAALAIGARLVPGMRTIDDAYITYRYARNIVEGVGMVYNAGQPVLGTTTPLYTLLMAGLAAALRSGAYPAISVTLNALADGATAALLYRLARRALDHPAPGALLGLLWAISPMSVTFAIGGMETSLSILLMVGAFSVYLDGRTAWAFGLAALGTHHRLAAGFNRFGDCYHHASVLEGAGRVTALKLEIEFLTTDLLLKISSPDQWGISLTDRKDRCAIRYRKKIRISV